jgi:hypothetical protein
MSAGGTITAVVKSDSSGVDDKAMATRPAADCQSTGGASCAIAPALSEAVAGVSSTGLDERSLAQLLGSLQPIPLDQINSIELHGASFHNEEEGEEEQEEMKDVFPSDIMKVEIKEELEEVTIE